MIQEATMMRFHPQTEYVKKMIKDKKVEHKKEIFDYLQSEMMNEQSSLILKDDFIAYFVPITVEQLKQEHE